MSFDKLVEEKIKEAMESGEFDDLPGRGKPLDLTAYFATPEEVRLGYSVLKNANVFPPEAQLLKEVHDLQAQFERCNNAAEKRQLKQQMDDRMLQYNLLVEYYKRKGRAG